MKQEGIPLKRTGQKQNKERACLFAKRTLKAAMSIEAAVAMAVFLFFVTVLVSFLLLISVQSDLQLAMEEAARSIGKKAYLIEHADALLAEAGEETGTDADGAGLGSGNLLSDVGDSDTESLLSAGINPLTLKAWILKDGVAEKIDRSNIQGGSGGIYTYHSSYDQASGTLDLVVHYTYRFPFLPDGIGKIRCVQRSTSHVWVGKELKESQGGAGKSEDGKEKVYVTPYGTVYHKSKSCPYLDLSIHSVSREQVDAERNKSGGKYDACPDCAGNGVQTGIVYITDYGEHWHTDLGCKAFKRTIEEKSMEDVGSLHACPKCGGEHEETAEEEATS